MKKITGNLDCFVSRVCNVFNASNIHTIQQMYLINICDEFLPPFMPITIGTFPKIKEKLLLWQAKENPSMNWITKKYSEWFFVKEFSHNDDFVWNSLDGFIAEYIFLYVKEIGCITYQESLIQEVLNTPIDFGNGIIL